MCVYVHLYMCVYTHIYKLAIFKAIRYQCNFNGKLYDTLIIYYIFILI